MPREIRQLLQSGSVMAHLHEQISQLEKINTFLQAHFPPTAGASVRAIKLQNATLTLRAPSSPVAARLRQSTPSMMQTLAAKGVAVKKMRITVHMPDWQQPEASAASSRTLGAKGQQAIARLAASLPADDRLRASLEGLLAADGKQP